MPLYGLRVPNKSLKKTAPDEMPLACRSNRTPYQSQEIVERCIEGFSPISGTYRVARPGPITWHVGSSTNVSVPCNHSLEPGDLGTTHDWRKRWASK